VRLGFDATSLTAAGKGLARFQAEFLRVAAAGPLVSELVVFVPDDVDRAVCPEVAGWRYLAVRTRPMLLWEQLGRPRAARRERLDAVITLSERASLWGPPEVVYIYEHPKHRAQRYREVGAPARQRLVNSLTVRLFGLAMRRAGAVLAASEATAADISPLRKAEVVHPGVSSVFSPGASEPSYFLHLASDDPRDNSEVVLEAYGQLERRPGLVIGGRAPDALRERALALGLDAEIRWAGFQTGEALADLYRGAIAYVDPSLYEGFGLQAAEALACGTPAIVSNVTSLPEVVGEAGVLLDPHDVAGFAEAMRRTAADPGLRAELSRRAVEQARRFRWEETARATLAAARRLAARA
jgi:glycosyltransferase involved in cell wall biosynthesis